MAGKTRKTGRKSAAAKQVSRLSVVDGGAPEKPEPPGRLSQDELEIWHAVLASEPVEFFQTEVAQALLADYCRHRVTADLLCRQINEFEPYWLKMDDGASRYDKLLRMRDRENQAVMRCATKLRITNQARYTPKAAATRARNKANKVAKPWEL